MAPSWVTSYPICSPILLRRAIIAGVHLPSISYPFVSSFLMHYRHHILCRTADTILLLSFVLIRPRANVDRPRLILTFHFYLPGLGWKGLVGGGFRHSGILHVEGR